MQPTHKRDDNWSRLLTRVGKQRDAAAFEALFNHFAPLIRGFCLASPTRSDDATEEFVQDVMYQVWCKSPYYEPHRASASTWIYTIMRNHRVAMACRAQRHPLPPQLSVDDVWDDATESQPFVFLKRSHNGDNINQRLHALPVEQFHVVKKIYSECSSQQQVATDLDLPVSTIRSRLRLALKKLQMDR